MNEVGIIINVNDEPQIHYNGAAGTWLVPPRPAGKEFSMLVVYPTAEIQDVGSNRVVAHWPKPRKIAMDIVGMHSEEGSKEKWGLLLCEAQPQLPNELLDAIQEETEYLGKHMPEHRYKKDNETQALVVINVEDPEVRAKKQELSDRVVELRQAFEKECLRLVTKAEIERAKKNLLTEDLRLISVADRMWASNRPGDKESINEKYQGACRRTGQERPWCYTPGNLVDCPGCGAKIKENILSCPACHGWLDEGIEELRKMKPKERSVRMYPERLAEPVGSGSAPRARA
jgi:hypothetical protein